MSVRPTPIATGDDISPPGVRGVCLTCQALVSEPSTAPTTTNGDGDSPGRVEPCVRTQGLEPPPLGEVLDELAGFVRRFVVMSPAQADAVALWIVHTHVFDAAEQTPYLAISSAEKRSGKTRLLEVLELLVARPWLTGRVTAAVLARRSTPNGPRSCSTSRTRRSRARRNTPRRSAACSTPDTAAAESRPYASARGPSCPTRTSPPTARRRSPASGSCRTPSLTARCRSGCSGGHPTSGPNGSAAATLRGRPRPSARHWSGSTNIPTMVELEVARPDLPAELDDRAQDAAEPLLAIADRAEGDWPARARRALVELHGGREVDDESSGVRLLADIRAVLGERDRIATADLLTRLHGLDEAPWGDWYGRPLSARKLAEKLRPYGVHSRTVRFDDGSTAEGVPARAVRGRLGPLHPYFPPLKRHNATTRSQSGIEPDFQTPQDGDVADPKSAANPHPRLGCGGCGG